MKNRKAPLSAELSYYFANMFIILSYLFDQIAWSFFIKPVIITLVFRHDNKGISFVFIKHITRIVFLISENHLSGF